MIYNQIQQKYWHALSIKKKSLITPPQPLQVSYVIENTIKIMIYYQSTRPSYLLEPLTNYPNYLLYSTLYDLFNIVSEGLDSKNTPK